uniref:amidohydrolase family protein n=1 Tax=Desulfovibrio sp. TaxID=885 RepID=UPI00307AF3FF
MLQEHDDRLRIIRARTILDMLGERPATGRDLFRPLKGLDNAALLVRGGRVLDVLPWKSVRVPAGTPVTDMGDVTLMPGSINAHCHLQLSHTAGRTLFGAGFTAWLRSLIALLREEHDGTALIGACRDMAATGTAHVGDYAGDGLLAVDAAVRAEGMGVTHFCEWFGGQAPFIDDGRPWPPRCRALLERRPEVAGRCAPAGHALYSTDARVLQDARQWCRLKGRPFALHLAESEDETRLLLDGEGPLWDCYRGMVLPEGWAVPHLRPVAYARRLDLLGPGTLAVHGVQLEPAEVTALAASGSAL